MAFSEEGMRPSVNVLPPIETLYRNLKSHSTFLAAEN